MKTLELLGAALVASVAWVQPSAAAGGWYAGFDAGLSEADAEISEVFIGAPATDDADASSTGFRVRFGYQFARYIAAEIGYADFGDFDYEFDPDTCPVGGPDPCPFNATTSISGLQVNAVGTLPLGDRWTINARAGWSRLRVKHSELATVGIDNSTTKDGFHVGIGVGYAVSEHWDVLLDYTKYEQLDLGLSLGGAFGYYDFGDTRLTSLGVNYRW
jgi:OmpA-OmpF porin, OOP family